MDIVSDLSLLTDNALPESSSIPKLARVSIFTRIIFKQVTAFRYIIYSMPVLPSGWAHNLLADCKRVCVCVCVSDEFEQLQGACVCVRRHGRRGGSPGMHVQANSNEFK